MSKPQPDSRSNFIQTLLFMAVIFMGFQIWQQSQNPNKAADTRTSAVVWQKMVEDNQKCLDVTITSDANVWEQKYRAEAGTAKTPADEIEAQIIRAHILIADTRIKSAQYWPDKAHDKIQKAYDVLKSTYEKDVDSPVWDSIQAVAPDGQFKYTSISARELYGNIVADLTLRNHTEKVYGLFPGYPVIDFLVKLTGSQPGFSYAFAAFMLALIVRSLIWPLTQKQFIWGRQMQQLQPMLKELEAQHRDPKTDQVDQQAYHAAAMKLYGEYGLNPLLGCWPAMVQIPFFFTIFQCMQLYRFEFTKGTFLWIHPGATKFLGIHIAPNLGERDYILIVIYGITMVISTMLTPVSDPTQMKQQRGMGLIFAVGVAISMFFYPLASAFILYWIFTNVLATIQSLLIYRKKLPPLQKKFSPAGGSYPLDPPKGGNGAVSSDFFTKTGTKKANKAKKKN